MQEPPVLLAERYRLDGVLGAGGMGQVWQGYDTTLERVVAVKGVTVPYGAPPEEVAAFYEQAAKEARNAARVSHLEDVITVFDVVTDQDGRPWIIMDLLESLTLQQDVKLHGPWSAEKLAESAGRLLWVVDQIHTRYGIVHRDLKPSNLMVLMVALGAVLKILDFGIARYTGDTVTGSIRGTVEYMAPEYLNGSPATPASDAWSLGLVLYYVLTGKSLFERSTPEATMVAIMQYESVSLEGDEPIHVVIRGLLRKDPKQRMSLDKAARLLGANQTVLLPASPTQHFPAKRRARLVAAGAVAAIVAVVAGSLLIPKGQDGTGDKQATSGAATTSAPSSLSSAASSASVSASATSASPTAQVAGNVYTSDTMRVEAPAGWNIDAPGALTYANLWKEGEGYVYVTRLTGLSLASLVQEQRQNLGKVESLSDVTNPQPNIALWTHSLPRFYCFDFPCGSTLVWSTVVAVDGGYVAITYHKQVKGPANKNAADDARAIAAIRAVANGVRLL